MSFDSNQLRLHATRPWHSLDSVRVDRLGRQEKREENLYEIASCLNCPFPDCSGTGEQCRTYRLHYIARLEGREP